MFCLLNCSSESSTHLVEEVQLIQPLQVKTATNMLVKTSTIPSLGLNVKNLPRHHSPDFSKAPDIWFVLRGVAEEFYG